MSTKDEIKSDKNEKHWTIQCPNPKCLCDDVSRIEWSEQYPVYSKLHKEEDGSISINTSDGEVFWDGGGDGGQLSCGKCGHEWAMPENALCHTEFI